MLSKLRAAQKTEKPQGHAVFLSCFSRRPLRRPAIFLLGFCLVLVLLMEALPTVEVAAQKITFKDAGNSPIGVGDGPISVAVGDFNGDGNWDLAVANAVDNTITVLLGDGQGNFSPSPANGGKPFGTGANLTTAITVADVNGDGHADLVYTGIPGGLTGFVNGVFGGITGGIGANASVLLGDGTGNFGGHIDSGTGGNFPSALAVGDFNGDGLLDVAVTNFNDGTVSILLGDGKGGFNAKNPPIQVGFRPAAVVAADFNGDGILDLAVANSGDNTITILTGHNDGTFPSAAYIAVGSRPVSIAVGDFNGDGRPDLAVANLLSSTVSILLNMGPTFSVPTSIPVGRYPSAVAAADFNNDGKLDLAVVNRLTESVFIMAGNGDGTFAPFRTFAVQTSPQSIAVADFNHDGQLDMAVGNVASNTVSVILNSTDIIPPTTVATQNPPPNGNGWNNTTVTLTLSATDNPGGSGVKSIHYTIGNNPPVTISSSSTTLTFSNEGIFPVTYYADDNAGNVEKTHSLTIQIDLTPPTITSAQSPPANGAGWNNSNVTVTFTCADALSGVASCTIPVVVSTEGANQTITGTAADLAGNSAQTSRTINLDETPPVLTMPNLASSYLYNSSLTLNFSAADPLSGVASTQATFNGKPVTNGTTFVLNQPGTNTFTLTSTDVAGNTTTQTATFSVLYQFSGFLPPIPNDGSGLFKLGSTVPVKFQLTDANGAIVGTAVANLTVQMYSGGTLVGAPIDATPPGNADVGDLFRFDGSQYIYNLSTKTLTNGTWQIQARLNDGSVHAVLMGTK